MKDVRIAFRKPIFPISESLMKYLDKHNRTTKIQVLYEDLLRFSDSVVIEDKEGKDTLWRGVFYPEHEFLEIEASLNKIYTLLHSDGDEATLPFLKVDTIDFCTFGNSQPFRIRVRNILNDNYTNFYIKRADASRIYGLELEDLLSPNRINYLIYKNTLIEEHILGIPGDVFIKNHLSKCSELEKSQISKEFVKFNERCLIGLLGDMRSYNYVIIPVHDFDQVIYRIRPIDFDQQTYEGNFKVYLPQYFKENSIMVKMVLDKLKPTSIEQYRKEVRSQIVKRVTSSKRRFDELISIMKRDNLAPEENVNELKKGLQKLTYDVNFKYCKTMGDIIETGIKFVVKNYKIEL
ncbi:hypothetical protein [Elizabethkingia sp. JS20170427COW]|uniref:hypothetical protein n=1 Tax=Elizabethkingia sp. JS20170427COW TaxID=2583851 RepID=UPI001110E807|nr:hypothetical protein [Elizabethkingia sp. JS20170427COW]QCX53346.1 hypothetical protein FGE20_06155 [Elizabethkingia sp. JS20170427COW]